MFGYIKYTGFHENSQGKLFAEPQQTPKINFTFKALPNNSNNKKQELMEFTKNQLHRKIN